MATRKRQTDAGNAALFASLFKDHLRYDHARQRWFVWQGNWWGEETKGQVMQCAKTVARYRLKNADRIGNEEDRKHEVRWAMTSESRPRADAMIALAQSEAALADDGKQWDSDPWLIGVSNGVVNLRTGKLRNGRQSDCLTLHTDVAFDPSAKCPLWDKFVLDVFSGDMELVEFVQRALGYCVSGDTSEQCLFLCYGTGANGKSTLLTVLGYVLGGYACNLPFSAFELRGRSSASNDVAALVGRRFVTAVETDESCRLNEARIKALTGGDPITARFLYREFFSFRPVAKFWLAFNHKPQIADDSPGFWRRVRLIPFLQEFTGEHADRDLIPKLLAEAPGILAWLVRGCLAWQRQGLGLPPVIKEATEMYREECDPLADFLTDCCVVGPNYSVTTGELWDEYQVWSSMAGSQALDRQAFARRLEARGFKPDRVGHRRRRVWVGVGLMKPATPSRPESAADVRTCADTTSVS